MSKLETFLPKEKKRLLCVHLVIFSPRHNKNFSKALNVGHVVRHA